MTEYTADEVRDLLRKRILARYGSQQRMAELLGITQSAVSKVLSGQNPPPQWALNLVGVRKEVRTVYIAEKTVSDKRVRTLDTPSTDAV